MQRNNVDVRREANRRSRSIGALLALLAVLTLAVGCGGEVIVDEPTENEKSSRSPSYYPYGYTCDWHYTYDWWTDGVLPASMRGRG